MSGFNFDTGFGDVDPYTSFGAGGYANVLTDVSMGSQDEQPYTATGNGSGVFLDSSTQNGIFGVLEKGLNYALHRDQQKMTAVAAQPVQQAQVKAQVEQAGNSRILLYALIAGAIIFMVNK
jgi:UDP-N-acetylenolpyruvoylglucosamine reductase